MLDFSLEEAQLYRMLAGFFGRDRIVPHMSLMAVCGGEIPAGLTKEIRAALPQNITIWAKETRCLFTIVDQDDSPKLVLDFDAIEGSGELRRGNYSTVNSPGGVIDSERIQYQRFMEPLLDAAGVRFFKISNDEFSELLKPSGNLDLFSFFRARFEELGFKIGPEE